MLQVGRRALAVGWATPARALSSAATLRSPSPASFAAPPPLRADLPPVDAERIVTPDVAQAFAADGAVVLRGAFAQGGWVEALRAAAEDNMANPGPLCDEHAQAQGAPGRFHDDQFLWLRHDTFRQFVTASGAAAVAARAMGSTTAHIFYDQLLAKEPGTITPTPWHNDTSYWHLSGKQICSIWVALDEVDAEAGVAYVAGSHTWGLRHRVTNFSGDAHSDRNVYEGVDGADPFDQLPDIDAGVADGSLRLLSWDMAPGDALLFDSAAVHGAPGPRAGLTRRRRGYATRWCGDDVRFDSRPGTMDQGWRAAGYDCGLSHGEPIASGLHPDVLAMRRA